MRNMLKTFVLSGLLVTGLVGALIAQTTRVAPVTTITCPGGDFVSALGASGVFTCGTPSGSAINQLTGDVTAGPGSGSQAATLATVNGNVGSFTGADITVNAKGLITAAANGSKGLYNQVLSATPTSASTGLSTWLNQATATVTDAETGLIVAGALSATNISGRTKAVPATPYSVDVLVDWDSITNTPAGAYGLMIGWTDGTKIQAFTKFMGGGSPNLLVLSYATVTSGASAAVVDATQTAVSRQQWLRLRDDGTNVHFALLPGGSHSAAIDLFTVAKASGYLGSGGYSSLFFGINRNAGQASAVLLSYTER